MQIFNWKTLPGSSGKYSHYLDRRTGLDEELKGKIEHKTGPIRNSGCVWIKGFFSNKFFHIIIFYSIVPIYNCSAHSTCLSLSWCSSTKTYKAADTINTHLVSGTPSRIRTFINVFCKEINKYCYYYLN